MTAANSAANAAHAATRSARVARSARNSVTAAREEAMIFRRLHTHLEKDGLTAHDYEGSRQLAAYEATLNARTAALAADKASQTALTATSTARVMQQWREQGGPLRGDPGPSVGGRFATQASHAALKAVAAAGVAAFVGVDAGCGAVGGGAGAAP